MKIFSRKLSMALTVAVIAAFVFYFMVNLHKFRPLLHINLLLLLVIAAADISSVAVSGLFTKFILKPFNKHIPLKESFFVSLISSVGNFFAPVGAGFGFRAIYLKRKFGLPYSEYISTLSGNYILVFLVNSGFGLLSLYLLKQRHNSEYGVLVAVFAVLFLVSLVLSLVRIPMKDTALQRNRYAKSFIRNLARITKGWNHIVSRRRLMLQLACLTILNLVITMLITLTIIKSLHLNITFAPLLLFSVLGSLSLFINLTPANLGVKEAIYLFSSSILGFSAAQILSIALIDRGVLFLVLLVLWLFSSRLQSGVSSFNPSRNLNEDS